MSFAFQDSNQFWKDWTVSDNFTKELVEKYGAQSVEQELKTQPTLEKLIAKLQKEAATLKSMQMARPTN